MKFGSAKLKLLLIVISMGIVVGLLLYTQHIVDKLQKRERAIVNLVANAFRSMDGNDSEGDITFVFSEIIQAKEINNFPIIISDPNHEIYSSKNVPYIENNKSLTFEQQQTFLKKEAERMRSVNEPIILRYGDSTITQYVYYDESELVQDLRILPYIEIFVASLFILVGYLSFSYIKRHEQANIWVGMSKETAHQLGTPLSSLAGWIEMIKFQQHDPPALAATIGEMEHDLQRLNRIALRFSKIGSQPDLNQQNINETVYKMVEYFRKRIPQSGKKIELVYEAGLPIEARYNAELLEWVIENITKNALDAIDAPNGKITFKCVKAGTHVLIDISDTGKGIEKRVKKDIFRPGFSTKKRGWGLGLSLAKRIVENYHRGKLYVLESSLGKGTTFRIKIPV